MHIRLNQWQQRGVHFREEKQKYRQSETCKVLFFFLFFSFFFFFFCQHTAPLLLPLRYPKGQDTQHLFYEAMVCPNRSDLFFVVVVLPNTTRHIFTHWHLGQRQQFYYVWDIFSRTFPASKSSALLVSCCSRPPFLTSVPSPAVTWFNSTVASGCISSYNDMRGCKVWILVYTYQCVCVSVSTSLDRHVLFGTRVICICLVTQKTIAVMFCGGRVV